MEPFSGNYSPMRVGEVCLAQGIVSEWVHINNMHVSGLSKRLN